MDPEIKIVAVATHDSGYLKWLSESCIRNGTELIILGMGTPWEGYITKPKLLKDFLDTQDDNTIVCVVDAYDVIMLKNVEELKQKFIQSGHNIIFSLIPNAPIFKDLIEKSLRYEFGVKDDCLHVNSGVYMGYVKNLKNMTNSIMQMYIETNENDDEKLTNIYYGSHESEIYVDVDREYFHNVSPFLFSDEEDYGQNSWFLHRIGNAPLTNFLEAQGYKVRIDEKLLLSVEFFDEMSKKLPYHISATLNGFIGK